MVTQISKMIDQGHRAVEEQGMGLNPSGSRACPLFSLHHAFLPSSKWRWAGVSGLVGRWRRRSANGQSPRPRLHIPGRSPKDSAGNLKDNSSSCFWHGDTKGCNSQSLLSKGPQWSRSRRWLIERSIQFIITVYAQNVSQSAATQVDRLPFNLVRFRKSEPSTFQASGIVVLRDSIFLFLWACFKAPMSYGFPSLHNLYSHLLFLLLSFWHWF